MILLLIKVSSIANTTDKWYFCTPALCSYDISVVWYYCTLRGPKDFIQMLLLCYFWDRGHALISHLLQPGHRDPLPTLLQPALWVRCVLSVGKQYYWPRLSDHHRPHPHHGRHHQQHLLPLDQVRCWRQAHVEREHYNVGNHIGLQERGQVIKIWGVSGSCELLNRTRWELEYI